MGKADKLVTQRRIQDVTKLVLAGAEFADIRQFANEQGWDVGDRQVRRYLNAAYQRMAKANKRDRKQLLGRHLMQRRALYARAVKGGDLRAALQMLKDEADLAGLYPPTKPTSATQDDRQPSVPLITIEGRTLTRRDRVARSLEAELRNNKAELSVIQNATPYNWYHLPDTIMPAQMLHILTLIHVNEQLESAGLFLLAAREVLVQEKNGEGGFKPDSWADCLFHVHAHLYRVRHDGWRKFTERVGVDGQLLIEANYEGGLLQICNENLLDVAPEADEVRKLGNCFFKVAVETLRTADDEARSWWQAFRQVCPEDEHDS